MDTPDLLKVYDHYSMSYKIAITDGKRWYRITVPESKVKSREDVENLGRELAVQWMKNA